MLEGVAALSLTNSESNMSKATSSSTGTSIAQSSLPDTRGESSSHAYGEGQIYDPLRFPVQNGSVLRMEPDHPTERDTVRNSSNRHSKSSTLSRENPNLNPQPHLTSQPNLASQSVTPSHSNIASQPNFRSQNSLNSQPNLTSQTVIAPQPNKAYSNLASQLNLIEKLATNAAKSCSTFISEVPIKSYETMESQSSCSATHDVASFPSSTSLSESLKTSDFTEVESVSKSSKEVGKTRDMKLSELEFCLPASQIYEPETVDFPSSPTTFRSLDPSLGEVVRLAEGEAEGGRKSQDELEEEDDRSVYTAIANPPTGKVILRKVERPKHLDMTQRKRLTVTEELLNICVDDDQQSVSSLSYHNSEDDDDDDAQMLSHDEFTDMLTPDDIDTPDELEESIMERLGPQPTIETQPETSTERDPRDEKSWRAVILSGIERRIDMKVIEPYKKVLSHGGYMPGGNNEAIIVFSACFLPDRSRRDYDYVMDHLFMYVLTTLDTLIGEDYVLVYLHGATTRGNMPSFAWLKRCYQMIDRRLRKNLQGLYLVHPTFWVKTVVVMARPFVSSKFARKLRFVSNLKELSSLIPLDQVCIPSRVKQYDVIRETLLLKKS